DRPTDRRFDLMGSPTGLRAPDQSSEDRIDTTRLSEGPVSVRSETQIQMRRRSVEIGHRVERMRRSRGLESAASRPTPGELRVSPRTHRKSRKKGRLARWIPATGVPGPSSTSSKRPELGHERFVELLSSPLFGALSSKVFGALHAILADFDEK